MNPVVLGLLRCPLTRQPLRLLSEDASAELGLEPSPVLLREDGRVYYPFDTHGFPILLPDAGRTLPRSGPGDDHGPGISPDAGRC